MQRAILPDPRQPVGKVLLDLGKFRGEVYTSLLRSAPGPAADVLGDIDKILSRAEEQIRSIVSKMPQPTAPGYKEAENFLRSVAFSDWMEKGPR